MYVSTSAFYYEDFKVGSVHVTGSRCIGPEEVRTFSALTMDQNPIHTDEQAMREHPFGRPIAHGMLVTSVAVGLISHLGMTRGTLVAMLEQTITYKKPVYVGDTVHVKLEVIDKRDTRNPMRGIVIYRYEVINDSEEVVVAGTNTNMVFKRNTLKKHGDKV